MSGIQVIGMCESGNQQTDARYLPVNGRKVMSLEKMCNILNGCNLVKFSEKLFY